MEKNGPYGTGIGMHFEFNIIPDFKMYFVKIISVANGRQTI
jgi:hypothetical protein